VDHDQEETHPQILGACWRAQMREECESVEALVWKRVNRIFHIDLADEKQASDMQVFLLLSPLLHCEITSATLKDHIDSRIPGIFPAC
jgi:hypothetical protein